MAADIRKRTDVSRYLIFSGPPIFPKLEPQPRPTAKAGDEPAPPNQEHYNVDGGVSQGTVTPLAGDESDYHKTAHPTLFLPLFLLYYSTV